jgi:glycosyltransferase involved in cell wall biosynthesis
VDLEHFYPRPVQEIQQVRVKYSISDEYIFMVGSLDPRKNIPTLFRAWEMLIQEQQISLVIAGGRGLAFQEIKINPVPPRVKFLSYVQESDLPALYSGAKAYINPSLYEGFGLSVLEAMACGSAVIASSSSSLPEVVGDAGLLVNPHDAVTIASAIASILSDHKTHKSLVQKGLERVKTYSWEKTAQGVWNAIIQVQNEI